MQKSGPMLSPGDKVEDGRHYPYKNEKVAAWLQLGCCYYAAIKYVCNNWWRQSSQLERLVVCSNLAASISGYRLMEQLLAVSCS